MFVLNFVGGLLVGCKFQHSNEIARNVGGNCRISFLPKDINKRFEDKIGGCLLIEADDLSSIQRAEDALLARLSELIFPAQTVRPRPVPIPVVNALPVVPPTIVLQPELRRHVIIDNSNLFISAQNRGGRHDPSVRINPKVLGRLFGGVEGKTGTRLVAGSKPPAKGKIWQVWENAGYRVKVCSRDVDTGAEDLVDEFLHAQAMNAVMAHAQDRPGENTLVLCTGDGNENHGFSNFVDVARNTAKMGWRVEIWSWRHSISRKYQQLANEHRGRLSIHYLDEFEDQIIFR